jgi:hypothetical protein
VRRGPAGRLLRAGLLAAAVAAVVALDTGTVALPWSTPRPITAGPVAGGRRSDVPGSGPTTAPSPATGSAGRATGIDAALGRMTADYATGDEAGFLAVVATDRAAVRGRLRQTYRNLRAVGYGEVRFSWPSRQTRRLPVDSPNLDPAAAVAPVVAAVEVRTRVVGFDPKASVSVLPLTFAERGGDWQVVGDAATDAEGLFDEDLDGEPWMLGAVLVVRRPHVVVVGEPKRRSDVERLATRLETAVTTVRGVWRVPSWNGKVVAYATTDPRFVRYHFRGREFTGTTTGEAAFDARVTLLDATGISPLRRSPPSAARLVMTPYLLGEDDRESRATLRHELTHVAFAFAGSDVSPTWLDEGSAEYTGYRTGGASVDGVGALAERGLPTATWSALRRGSWKPRLVSDPATFYEGTREQVSAAYTTAWLTCLYIAETYGEQKLVALFTASAAMSAQDLTSTEVETRILRSVLKTDRKALLAGTTRYARRIRARFR